MAERETEASLPCNTRLLVLTGTVRGLWSFWDSDPSSPFPSPDAPWLTSSWKN